MKLRKLISFLFLVILAFVLVACGGNKDKGDDPVKADPLVPTAISLKVKTAKVQINKTLKLTYTISPATAQGNAVTVSVNSDKASAVVEGTNTIILTAGSVEGSVKLTVTCTNGISASKTIKIQVEEVKSYPDLSGYTIKIANAEHALGEYDVRLTKDTADKYGYYEEADREYKIQAIEEIEDNYNCTIAFVAYPSDAPWGPSRWNYILNQAQAEASDYDLYIIESKQIPGFVAGNAILDMTDWYAEYGRNIMSEMCVTSSSYKGRIYAFAPRDIKLYNIMGYNVNLYENLAKQDPSLKEPAQMYLDGNWTYTDFYNYCVQAQTALNSLYGESGETYYAVSGYGCYYWRGMVNAAGVKVLDNTQLKVSITGTTEAAAGQTLHDIYAAGAMDPAFQGDSVSTWAAGHSLFCTAQFWFVNNSGRWTKTLWGTEDETRYGFVPFPTSDDSDTNYVATAGDGFFVMPTGRDWAYKGFGDECTAENIYAAFVDYYATGKQYYQNSEDYSYVTEQTSKGASLFGSEASVKAYVQLMCGVQQPDGSYVGGLAENGFYDPFVADIVLSSSGSSGSFAGSVNEFIKGTGAAQWVDAVGTYVTTTEQALVELFG